MMRQAIVECERYVLKELGFELYRLSEHPHRYLLYFLKPLRPSPETIQKAWNYCNDCFLNTLCINYPPHVVAASCLYLAIRTTNSPMVRPIWWAIFETSIKHILDVSAELMKLYEQPKLTFTNVKEIIEAYHKRNNIDREYIIDNEAEFEKNQKIQQEEEAKLRAPVEKEKPKSGPAQSTDQKKDRKPDNKPQDDRKGDHRPRKSDYLDKYRNDKKKRKKHSRSRDRKRSYSSDSSSSDSESDRKKKKKKKSKRDRSSSSSEDRSSSRKKSRKDSSKRSSSRRKDKKKKDSRDRKQKKDRSRDRSRDKKYSNPPKLGRKNSLEMISDQIKENTIKERERYNQELEKKRTDKVTDENEEESFLKKAEKKPTTSKPTIPSISLEGLKAAALEKATQEENFSMSFVKSLQTEEFMRFEEKRSEAATIKAEEIKSSEQEPLKEQKNGNGKAHGEDDELDEERLAELRKKSKLL